MLRAVKSSALFAGVKAQLPSFWGAGEDSMYLAQVCQSRPYRVHMQQACCTTQTDFALLQACRLS